MIAAHATRRGFLRIAGGSAALAALANLRALPAAAEAGRAAPPSPDAATDRVDTGLRFFSPREAEILTAVCERMVDTGEPAAPPLRDTRAVASIDALCAALDPSSTAPLPALLQLVEWGPVLFEGRLARFTGLDAARQDASLAGWMRSRFGVRRVGFLALRNLALLGYWSQEETWPLIGYAGPLLRRGERARGATAADARGADGGRRS